MLSRCCFLHHSESSFFSLIWKSHKQSQTSQTPELFWPYNNTHKQPIAVNERSINVQLHNVCRFCDFFAFYFTFIFLLVHKKKQRKILKNATQSVTVSNTGVTNSDILERFIGYIFRFAFNLTTNSEKRTREKCERQSFKVIPKHASKRETFTNDVKCNGLAIYICLKL